MKSHEYFFYQLSIRVCEFQLSSGIKSKAREMATVNTDRANNVPSFGEETNIAESLRGNSSAHTYSETKDMRGIYTVLSHLIASNDFFYWEISLDRDRDRFRP
jgi:hypothetical protein